MEAGSASHSTTVSSSTETKEAINVNATEVSSTKAATESAVETGLAQQNSAFEVTKFANALKPFAAAFGQAAYNVTAQKVADFMGPIWDEFKKLSPWGKFFAVLGTAAIIGAVGYFGWKVVAGNWDTIKEFAGNQLKRIESGAVKLSETLQKNIYVRKVVKAFENGVESFQMSVADTKKLMELFASCSCVGLTEAFIENVQARKALQK